MPPSCGGISCEAPWSSSSQPGTLGNASSLRRCQRRIALRLTSQNHVQLPAVPSDLPAWPTG